MCTRGQGGVCLGADGFHEPCNYLRKRTPGHRVSPFQTRCLETMTRQEVISELAQEGYQPLCGPFMGSVVTAEAWTSRAKDKRLVIILYRSDTGEMVDLHDLPEDEENRPDVEAFIDDFRESVFRAGSGKSRGTRIFSAAQSLRSTFLTSSLP